MTDIKNAVRPSTFDEFVGQEKLINRLMPFLDRALKTEAPIPHILLTSAPGMGKTSLIEAIANYMGEEIISIDFSRLTPARLTTFWRRYEGQLIKADEIHALNTAQQNLLLTVLEEGYFPSPQGGAIEVPICQMVAATDRPQQLSSALLRRFSVRLDYDDYHEDDIFAMIHSMMNKLGEKYTIEDMSALASAAAGVPSTARDLVMAWDALQYSPEGPSVDAVLDICGMEKDGLTTAHMKYLSTLDALDGVSGETRIMKLARLNVNEFGVIEALLFDKGYISLGATGRILTPAGLARLQGDDAPKRKGRVIRG